jgi:segregation and condensation protein B
LTGEPRGAILGRVTEIDLVQADEEETAPAEGSSQAPDEEKAVERGPGEDLDDEALVQHAAALLFASPEPLSLEKLVQLLARPAKPRVRAALATLALRFAEARLPLQLTEIAGGWRILTSADLGNVIQRLAKVRKAERVTPAALETLSIVAYRQPVTNAEVEAIRGVQSGQMLRTLVDRGLVRVTGRAEQPGSPLQYGTTKEFLDRFGLGSIKDLPRDGELAKG